MEYIVLGKDGKEYGPVDGETLQKWVEHGRVFKDTKIRNALMKKWNEAGSMDSLHEAFSVQEIHEEEEEGVTGKVMGMFGLSSNKHEQKKEEYNATAFRQKYVPAPASVLQRVGAFTIDALLMAVYGLVLFFVMVIITGTWISVDSNMAGDFSTLMENSSSSEVDGDTETAEEESTDDDETETPPAPAEEEPEEEEEEEEAFVAEPVEFPPPASMHKTFYALFAFFVATILIYYGISLGIYAQTIGMWFWGIIIVKGADSEVFPARAFAFSLMMFLIGPLAPIVVFANPQHRSIHGYLTGTRLIKVTAHAKA